uniref:GG12534 n=1 Tax=Drosophila erecta TaxID=7220 RepID=B3P7M0_DROER
MFDGHLLAVVFVIPPQPPKSNSLPSAAPPKSQGDIRESSAISALQLRLLLNVCGAALSCQKIETFSGYVRHINRYFVTCIPGGMLVVLLVALPLEVVVVMHPHRAID